MRGAGAGCLPAGFTERLRWDTLMRPGGEFADIDTKTPSGARVYDYMLGGYVAVVPTA